MIYPWHMSSVNSLEKLTPVRGRWKTSHLAWARCRSSRILCWHRDSHKRTLSIIAFLGDSEKSPQCAPVQIRGARSGIQCLLHYRKLYVTCTKIVDGDRPEAILEKVNPRSEFDSLIAGRGSLFRSARYTSVASKPWHLRCTLFSNGLL